VLPAEFYLAQELRIAMPGKGSRVPDLTAARRGIDLRRSSLLPSDVVLAVEVLSASSRGR